MSHCDRKRCPACGGSWVEEREIPVVLFQESRQTYPTMEKAEEVAANYGWTPDNHMKFGKDVVGIEYPINHLQHYDGISEWHCMLCKARIGRWTGKVLEDDESEKRLGE